MPSGILTDRMPNRLFISPPDANGTYYLFLWTDVRGDLDETNLLNNFSALKEIQISPLPPSDLEVVSVNPLTQSVKSGQAIDVSWEVVNHGPGATVTASWKDSLYISADQTLDLQTAQLLGIERIDFP